MSPQQGTMGQNRSDSLTGEIKSLPENKKKMKTLAQRRQSAPSLVISKALTRSRSTSRESCLTPVSPESCPLVQAFLAECPARLFLDHAQAQLKTGLQTQERHLFLFNDTLLVAKAKSPTHFKVKAQARVCEMWVSHCIEEVCEGSTNPEKSFVVGWPTCNFVATFSSEEHKNKWLELIKSGILEGKDRDDPKTVPLKIFAKDVGNCAYAKTLAVSNADSTDDVIRMALLQFGISGCVKDHRLWVSSSKDEPPYPLIGHEFPFSVKMSHIRNGGSSAAGLGGGAVRDPTSPTDCPGVLLLDQCLPPDNQCQFILKPNKAVLGQVQLMEPAQQKTFKRKRSLINWPFWKGSNPQLDSVPLSPTSLGPTQGRLFGRSLSSICSPEHDLPKPVMDFLRNIPGSLLCVDLYDRWMDAMGTEGAEEKMQSIHRLLHLLPGENLLLLRHVIAVLHCIQGNAQDNQMNAFNLSVCIAPSMLWSQAPSTPEMEGEGTKKVCELVRLLIENCCGALGDDVTALFRSFSQKSSSSDHGSDVSSFQMNDSSYDSLENELNDDPESPYQEQLPLRDKDKPDSRSRDSVITLSDCDPDPDPEAELLLQLPQLARPRRFSPAVRQPRPRQANGQSQGPRRLRRSSEPALTLESMTPSCTVTALANTQRLPVRKASYDAAMEGKGEEDRVFLEQRLSGLQLKEEEEESNKKGGAKVQNGGRRKVKHTPPPPLRLDASCSSLSSPATSPTGSSLSSLDSAFSQYSTDYTTNGAVPLAEPAPLSPGRPEMSPKGSPPQREAWTQPSQPPSNSHGLHPNTWLSKDRCLSLRQPEEDTPAANRKTPTSNGYSTLQEAKSSTCQRRSSSPPSYQQALLQLQRNRSPFYRGTEKPLTVKELRQLHDQTPSYNPKPQTGSDVTPRLGTNDHVQPPQGVFYGQSGTTLVLQRQKSHPLTQDTKGQKAVGTLNLPRRASEPPVVNLNLTSSLTRDRAHASKGTGGLRVSEVESSHSEPRFCLSPSATRAVRDYFSSQGQEDADGCLRRSQEVALAIVQRKREWQSRRCSDPRVDEFEKLFFAEESYV
ncbi:hypothetical protein fugu_000628 [Takifugu bimaculatus]|uniref:Rho-GAP domain-containing protein n=1 Tax=Takifugu bimaculatus TaxID=433685 RepID=A0A4Z2CH80_9TELE|nr:hypothetical protein fugu_000628 [Takifugu bimaculatus]